jgi:hypothetical protein
MKQEMYENDLGTDIHTEEIEDQFVEEGKGKETANARSHC